LEELTYLWSVLHLSKINNVELVLRTIDERHITSIVYLL